MAQAPSVFDASMSSSSFNTRVDDPERDADLSRTFTQHTFTEDLANIARARRAELEAAGDALDGEVNEKQDEKRIGPDPYMVVFEPGDPENPKVRVERVLFVS